MPMKRPVMFPVGKACGRVYERTCAKGGGVWGACKRTCGRPVKGPWCRGGRPVAEEPVGKSAVRTCEDAYGEGSPWRDL